MLSRTPVTDIDRAIAFYTGQVGFTLDLDHRVSEEIRFVQITPPGSARSILVGHLTENAPGTQRGLQCVIPDADAALTQLREAGVDAQGVDEQPWVPQLQAAHRARMCSQQTSNRRGHRNSHANPDTADSVNAGPDGLQV